MAPPNQMALTMERLVRAARISWPTYPTSRNFQLIFKASTLPGYLGTRKCVHLLMIDIFTLGSASCSMCLMGNL
ncbi:unnamed protein product [Musa textilis]